MVGPTTDGFPLTQGATIENGAILRKRNLKLFFGPELTLFRSLIINRNTPHLESLSITQNDFQSSVFR